MRDSRRDQVSVARQPLSCLWQTRVSLRFVVVVHTQQTYGAADSHAKHTDAHRDPPRTQSIPPGMRKQEPNAENIISRANKLRHTIHVYMCRVCIISSRSSIYSPHTPHEHKRACAALRQTCPPSSSLSSCVVSGALRCLSVRTYIYACVSLKSFHTIQLLGDGFTQNIAHSICAASHRERLTGAAAATTASVPHCGRSVLPKNNIYLKSIATVLLHRPET